MKSHRAVRKFLIIVSAICLLLLPITIYFNKSYLCFEERIGSLLYDILVNVLGATFLSIITENIIYKKEQKENIFNYFMVLVEVQNLLVKFKPYDVAQYSFERAKAYRKDSLEALDEIFYVKLKILTTFLYKFPSDDKKIWEIIYTPYEYLKKLKEVIHDWLIVANATGDEKDNDMFIKAYKNIEKEIIEWIDIPEGKKSYNFALANIVAYNEKVLELIPEEQK